jgi:serine/threonine-protein kinase
MPSEDTTSVLDATRAEPAAAAARASLTHSATVAKSDEALANLEATRVRGLMNGIAGSAAVTAVVVWLLGGDPRAVRIHAAALAGSAVLSGAVALWIRNPKRYSPQLALYVVLAQIGVLISGYYFWGIFSAYGALVPLSVYIVVGSATRKEAILGVGACVVAQAGFSLATVFGLIDARGLVEVNHSRTPLLTELVAIALLQGITIGAAVAGRAARRDAGAALEEHNRALLELARREAQLAEAVADANAARDAGVGGAGRFTDQTIDGYRLGEVLGRGAMGEVYAAQRADEDTPLAMKLLAPHLLRERSARERFLRESAIVSRLESPHCVRVVAVSDPDAALPYIVMERLEGTDLAQLLKQQSVRPLDEVRELVNQVAAGLDAAHRAGIIHRDLKPSNIYLAHGTWKILDFGASKWRDGDGTLTEGNIIGTPGYMSPEQALGRPIDQRSDVYALGVILYRVVTGVPAVVPGELPAMLQEVSYRVPPRPKSVSPGVEAVLAVALAKSPMHRFATAGELASVLDEAIAGKVDRAIAHRAHMLLADHPWGTWMRG